MIEKLILDNFGKFSGESFDLSRTTLFYGKNESGKTTIFDSLLINLANLPKTTTAGRTISGRYMNNVSTSIIPRPFKKIELDHFINLYSIREGDAGIDLNTDKGLVNSLRDSLYNSGIDPGKIGDELEKMSKDSKNLVINRKILALEDEKRTLEIKLNNLRGQRDEILSKKSRTDENEKAILLLESAVLEQKLARESLVKRIELYEKHLKRKEALDILEIISKHEAIVQRYELLKKYNSIDPAKFSTLKDDERRLEKEILVLSGEVKVLSEKLSDISQSQVKEQDRLIQKDRFRGILATELGILENTGKKMKIIKSFNILSLLPAIASILIGVGCFFILQNPAIRITALFIGLLAGALMPILLRKGSVVEDHQSMAEITTKSKDRIRVNTGGEINPLSDSFDGLKNEISRIVMDIDAQAKSFDEKKRAIVEQQIELDRKKQELTRQEEQLSVVVKSISEWLNSSGITDMMQLNEYKKEIRQLSTSLSSSDNLLAEKSKLYGVDNQVQLKNECHRLINLIDSEGLTHNNESAPLARLRSELKGIDIEYESLKNRLESMKREQAAVSGHITGSLGSIPQALVETAYSLDRINKEIDKLNLEKRACRIASGIFSEIAKDTGLAFQELSKEFGEVFGSLFGDDKKVVMSDIRNDAIMMDDAMGNSRQIDYLSTGTKDAFRLGMRLLFAKKLREDSADGFIILDEPFRHLDREREKSAVKMLKKFQDETGWQIIMFTMDEVTVGLIEEVFTDCLTNRL